MMAIHELNQIKFLRGFHTTLMKISLNFMLRDSNGSESRDILSELSVNFQKVKR